MMCFRQRGSAAVTFALMLAVMVGFCGLAIDLGMMYFRKSQLQNAADSVALAAAFQLNGTTAGVNSARIESVNVGSNQFIGQGNSLEWSDTALTFSADPDAPDNAWLSIDAAKATPANLRYARVNTNAFGDLNSVRPLLMGVLGSGNDPVNLAGTAVAGPHAMNVLPFAICAMSSTASATRANGGAAQELVEYGFRYGVGYNLLNLNPAAGATSGEYFYIDPIAPPGTPSLQANLSDSQLAPFICNGTLAYATLAGAPLNLRRPAGFNLWQQLNSRFDSYGGAPACNPEAAPPDSNIRSFSAAAATWMNNAAALQTAQATAPAAGQPLRTIADPAPVLPPVASGLYGVLWAYGPARRSTGSNFGTVNWQILYPSAPAMAPGAWPSSPAPYKNAAYTTAPSRPGRSGRRVLYVPLLSCPVAAGQYVTASVLAVARFLMTAPATSTVLSAEYAGVLTTAAAGEPQLSAEVELIR
ncbi:pilus assembly protein TadG-related protein [Pseudoduganella sp. RAF53_2]|uniref:pilus assembly protein TadG-related protein n=1 Tax=unclassified Pseudoduganella TaxID=2637179 RepID=UPI003F97C836